MKTRRFAALGDLLLAGSMVAQTSIPLDAWVIGSATDWFATTPVAGGIQVVWINITGTAFVVPVAGLSGNTYGQQDVNALAVDPAGNLYYSVAFGHPDAGAIYKVSVTWTASTPPTAAFSGTPQRIKIASGSVFDVPQGLVFINDGAMKGLYYTTFAGLVYAVNSTATDQVGTLITVAPFLSNAITSNGRELVVTETLFGGGPFPAGQAVNVVDLYNLTGVNGAGVPLFATRTFGIPATLGRGMVQLSMDREGKCFGVAETGQGFLIDLSPTTPGWTALSGVQYSTSRGNAGVANPWSRQLGIVPGSTGASVTRQLQGWVWTSGTTWTSFGAVTLGQGIPTAVVPFAPPTFELFGRGCSTAVPSEPRIGWTGVPLQGTSYTITLRGGQPNNFSLLRIGLSNTTSSDFGALPADMAPLGAPGCTVYVSNDSVVSMVANSSGQAAYTAPLPSGTAFTGVRIYYQWIISSPGANAAGLVGSDACWAMVR